MRFILDTNVVMSALISRVATAPPRILLEALADAHFDSVVSAALVLEWREVSQRPKLRRYFRLDAAGVEFALTRIEQLSDMIDAPQTVEDAAHLGSQTSATAPSAYSTCRTAWAGVTGAGAFRSNAS